MSQHWTLLLGGYYYFGRDNFSHVAGPRAEIDMNWKNTSGHLDVIRSLTLLGGAQYDNVRHANIYTGLRVSFGQQNVSNSPVADAMTGYIRRDINVITSAGIGPLKFLRDSNGKLINVQDVRNSQELLTATGNTTVDVVAVQNNINSVNNVALGDGQTITGKNYPFTREGVTFNAQLAPGSVALAADSGQDALRVRNNTVRDLTITVDSNRESISAQDQNPGTVIIDGITTNGQMDLRVAGDATSTHTASVSITNSQINYNGPADSTAIDLRANRGGTMMIQTMSQNNVTAQASQSRGIQVGADNTGGVAGQTAGQIIVNGNVSNNTIVTTDNAGLDSRGMRFLTRDGASVVINGNISNNVIQTNNQGSHGLGLKSEDSNSIITLNGNIANNTITVNGQGAKAIRARTENGGTIVINGNISNNALQADGQDAKGINIRSEQNASSITVNGEIANNAIMARGQDGRGINLEAEGGNLQLNNTIKKNVISISDSADAIRLRARDSGAITSGANGGDIRNNQVIASASTGDAIHIIAGRSGSSTGTVSLGSISNNTVTGNLSTGVEVDAEQTGSTVSINGLNGNQLNQEDIDLTAEAGTTITVNVNQGNTGLSAANNNATVNTSGAGTININPGP